MDPVRALSLTLFVLLAATLHAQSERAPTARTVDAINPSLSALDETPNLETPLACVEHFMLSARDDDFETAAHALHFRLVDDMSDEKAKRLAERFFYVLNQELWID